MHAQAVSEGNTADIQATPCSALCNAVNVKHSMHVRPDRADVVLTKALLAL